MKQLKWRDALRPLDGNVCAVLVRLVCLGMVLSACQAAQVGSTAQQGKADKTKGIGFQGPNPGQGRAGQTPSRVAQASEEISPFPTTVAELKLDAAQRVKVVIAPPPGNPLIGEEAMLFLTQQGQTSVEAVLGKPFEVVSISPRFGDQHPKVAWCTTATKGSLKRP